jgi:hypothetical protein
MLENGTLGREADFEAEVLEDFDFEPPQAARITANTHPMTIVSDQCLTVMPVLRCRCYAPDAPGALAAADPRRFDI